jgi:hypothetical protein
MTDSYKSAIYDTAIYEESFYDRMFISYLSDIILKKIVDESIFIDTIVKYPNIDTHLYSFDCLLSEFIIPEISKWINYAKPVSNSMFQSVNSYKAAR